MVKVLKYITKRYMAAKNSEQYNHKKFVIDSAFVESIGMDEDSKKDKVCIHLQGIEEPLVLNQTNLSILMNAFGEDTDKWINETIIINIVTQMFNNEPKKGLQVEPVIKK